MALFNFIAAGFQDKSAAATATTYGVTVGAAGSGGSSQQDGNNGGTSSFNGTTSAGGGGGLGGISGERAFRRGAGGHSASRENGQAVGGGWFCEEVGGEAEADSAAAEAGADIATIPYKVIKQMYRHPLTDIGLERFVKDAEKAGIKI
jgi:hypothetical protein